MSRGPGSGNGKTAGRGYKGAQSRSGWKYKRGFEGGQMPLHRRVPKRGFTNIFRTEYDVVNLDQLEALFDKGATVTVESLREHGIAVNNYNDLKLSEEKNKQLTGYMSRFTMPLIKEIYGDDSKGITRFEDIVGLFKDPDVKKALEARSFVVEVQGPAEFDKFIGTEFRSRYVNPTWIEGMKKEGYAGAGEMRSFVEYLWGWDATAPEVIDDAKWKETFDLLGVDDNATPGQAVMLRINRAGAASSEVPLRLRLDTPAEIGYVRCGGILPYIFRSLSAQG